MRWWRLLLFIAIYLPIEFVVLLAAGKYLGIVIELILIVPGMLIGVVGRFVSQQ